MPTDSSASAPRSASASVIVALADRLFALADAALTPRILLGIVGAPGAGKSTIAAALAAEAAARGRGDEVAVLPLDGFHLSDRVLSDLGRLDRKGAIDTFDGWGFVALLRRLHSENGGEQPRGQGHAIYAPSFERTLEQPIAGGIAIGPDVRVVIVEGNYLLDAEEPWGGIRPLLAECWYVETDEAVRLERLRARHEQFGKSPADARAWVARVDQPNARRIAGTRARAELVVQV